MIAKSDAIVLKSMRYRDSSRIVTFYTRKYGKLKAIAKGARDTKSKFGASLEPMTLSSLVFYKKDQRDLQFISQCDIVRSYKRTQTDIHRMAVGLSIVELVNQLTHDEEENLTLFSLLVKTLDALEQSETRFESYFLAFELRLASLFGFGLQVEKCLSCAKKLEFTGEQSLWRLDVEKGGFYCRSCSENLRSQRGELHYRLSAEAGRVLRLLLHLELEKLVNLEYSVETGNELNETLRLYLQYHIEGFKPLKSGKVFQQLHV